MSVKLTSYINFNGNAKEALDFYQTVFGGSVDSDTFGGFNEASGGAMPVSVDDQDKIMHATLTGDHVELIISDVPSTWPAPAASESNIVLSLSGDDDATLRSYWKKLGDGGTITQPLEKAPWGDTFGSVTDKFGISWMLDIAPAA